MPRDLSNFSADFRKRVEETRVQRDQVRTLVAGNRWREAEPVSARAVAYATRAASLQLPRGAESLIGDTDDLMPAWFLAAGASARRAVAFVEVLAAHRSGTGTGFLVSGSLFMTNSHVIGSIDEARGSTVTFDREMNDRGSPVRSTSFRLDPDRFCLFSEIDDLDYALIALGPRVDGTATLAELGYCMVSNRPDKHVLGMNVNIVQHPNGLPKMVAVRNNVLTARTQRTLLYDTDTDHGSSGSPVFSDLWELVALHHWGEPFLEKTDEAGKPIPTNVNEGVRISAIYDDLSKKLLGLPADGQVLLREALDYANAVSADPGGKRLSPPHPSSDGTLPARQASSAEFLPQPSKEDAMPDLPQDAQSVRMTVPLEITFRLGTSSAVPQTAPSTPAAAVKPPSKSLVRGAEKLPLDDDYSNRTGYDPDFIPGYTIPLPALNAKLQKQLASLRPDEPKPADGELKYEHFSIKMNRSKRIAIFTATNIDGMSYLNVVRTTGLVDKGAEGETWFKDPRISASFYLDDTFYKAWSNLFDHGHLTRRVDPNWGTPEEAQRANADTYHFTNCSPQHFRFNESTKYWQGAEQYVLENGALAEDSQNKILVYQGPIFDDAIDQWADDVQIPSSFFKVVVWKSKKGGLKSVALVVDQLALLSEQRVNLGQPRPAPFVDASQWRVSVESLQKRTGLAFDAQISSGDTIKDGPQPVVGEAAILLKSFADILPSSG